ncbi:MULTISPECIES: hypothetical protein [unclassified Bradyrhizobium]|uniref:hypothetical protein n=1 Tax=unclassified Bradyrhizobium TaxID=2631580 RepID=UPI0029161CF6|nr:MULTISPECIES: hypothetical protein [unclassified Bradyrhizobium]
MTACIERTTLTASWVEALTETQTIGRHVDGDETNADVGTLVDTLRTRLGPERVFRLAPVESEMPERVMKRISPAAPPTGGFMAGRLAPSRAASDDAGSRKSDRPIAGLATGAILLA